MHVFLEVLGLGFRVAALEGRGISFRADSIVVPVV
jgi:hypothetical protein